jgi:hypothetical protein
MNVSPTRTLLALALWVAAGTAHAFVYFNMPAGSTSWVELGANSCDGDCVGDVHGYSGAYVVPKPGWNFAPITATSSVTPDTLLMSHAASNTGGFTGQLAATGGLFTLHGSPSAAPLDVTARLVGQGEFRQGHTTTFVSATLRIGLWNDQPTLSDSNFRVSPTLGNATTRCNYNECAAGSKPWALQADYTLQALPGEAFNLGFISYLSLAPTALGSVGGDLAAHIEFDLPAGYYLTGTNGYDSRVLAVPEPSSLALLLAGLLLVLRRFRRTG